MNHYLRPSRHPALAFLSEQRRSSTRLSGGLLEKTIDSRGSWKKSMMTQRAEKELLADAGGDSRSKGRSLISRRAYISH